MAEHSKKPKNDAGTEKKATRTLKVELTPQEHAFVGLAANLRDETIAEYLSRVVAEAAMRDTQNTEKIRAEVNEGLKARRK
jgi:hypothetical protein